MSAFGWCCVPRWTVSETGPYRQLWLFLHRNSKEESGCQLWKPYEQNSEWTLLCRYTQLQHRPTGRSGQSLRFPEPELSGWDVLHPECPYVPEVYWKGQGASERGCIFRFHRPALHSPCRSVN